LKEKLLAALRAGLKTVVIPSENEKDLAEIPDNVKAGLQLVSAATMEEVLKVALVRYPEPIVWEEPELVVAAAVRGDPESDVVITH
jgi:ATP-dependent Lon protease